MKMVAPPMPASFMASRSLVMPAFVKLLPIQCHQTWGWYCVGGASKLFANVVRVSTSGCGVSVRQLVIMPIERLINKVKI